MNCLVLPDLLIVSSAVVTVAVLAGYAWGYAAGFRRCEKVALEAEEKALAARRRIG
jgi:hypothetical protein